MGHTLGQLESWPRIGMLGELLLTEYAPVGTTGDDDDDDDESRESPVQFGFICSFGDLSTVENYMEFISLFIQF